MKPSTTLPLLLGVVAGAPAPLDAAERHPPAHGRTGRSVVMARHGMVASSHPLATQAGLDILKAGGSAADAAIAVNATLGVVEPMSCGIGGDLFALVYDARTGKLHGLEASGRAPRAATRALFAERGLGDIPLTGPLSWSVPGCVDGWAELHRRFGRRPLAEVLAPAIGHARDGFPVSEVIAGSWAGAAGSLARDPDTAAVYLPGGRAPAAGEIFTNPALARCYEEIGQGGRDAFYTGRIAERLAAFSTAKGGLLAREDLAKHASLWTEPVSVPYRGYDVWELPPPGQGIAVLQILRLLEPLDVRSLGPTSPDYWHRLIEAKKLAYADRARFYADPAFARAPVPGLISAEYAATRAKFIDPAKALTDVPAGDPKLGASETVYLCVVDKDRNCVSLIQSNYYGFGSQLAPRDLGFALQNRGTLFALDEKHPNRLEPGKRPFHTIIPGMATKGGKPYLVFGVMGGDFQPQGQVQVLVNHLDFGLNVQAAGEAPRIEHIGSATPRGEAGDAGGGTVLAEPGIPDAVLTELERRGHHVRRVARNGGGYQAIRIDPTNGVLHGGSEYRKDGCAAGY
jgi:gamma-glutamyltranspeptidase/glutathione hydrolase